MDQKATEASWTKKQGTSCFGYIETGTASLHDSQHFDAVLDPSNTRRHVYADRGYPSEKRQAKVKSAGFRYPIQRKGKRNMPLSACQ